MWFDNKDLIDYGIISVSNLKGYVLPHAGTKFSGQLISHTLRFRPMKLPKNIFIIYLPSSSAPNVFWRPKNKNLYDYNESGLIPMYHEFAKSINLWNCS